MNAIDQFSVLFSADHVFIEKASYPIGQLVVDVLNLDEAVLTDLSGQLLRFARALQKVLAANSDEAIADAHHWLQVSLRSVSTLPVFRDLDIAPAVFGRVFQQLPEDKEWWDQVLIPDSEARNTFEEKISRLLMVGDRLRLFRKQISHMTGDYLDTMPRRNAASYADAFFLFYNDMLHAEAERAELSWGFSQRFPVEVDFVPMRSFDDEERIVLAERACFRDVVDFLEVEFYRGLMIGNAPRRCHNCGKYFLLTAGYNTCYCSNIAPGETDRTCRKVGAHRKEAQGRTNRTPTQKEYAKTYNRLKGRKQRGKISIDEWNAAVARAQELVAQSDRGELTDEELAQRLGEL